MSASNIADLRIGIGIDDKTAKGRKSVEKNAGQIPKHVSQLARRAADDGERSISRFGRASVRTLSSVEQASAKLFGNRSLSSGIVSRLSAIGEVGQAAGTGLGEAAGGAGMLETAIGGLGVAASATIGVLAAASYAAFKLVDGWSQNAAAVARTADKIGIAREEYQKFLATAERAGIDKGTASQGLGALSEALNGANYGTNPQVLALLNHLGVKLRTKADGTIDQSAMMPDIVEALNKQTAFGRRKAEGILGVEGLDSLFQDGKQSYLADMADAAEHANVQPGDSLDLGKRVVRKKVTTVQAGERLANDAGRSAAIASEGLFDRAASGAQNGAAWIERVAGVNSRAATTNDRAANRMDHAAGVIDRAFSRGLTPETIAAAQSTQKKFGIPASVTLAQYGLESSYGRHMPAGSNNPFGIKAKPGEPYVVARTREEDGHGRSYYTNARFRRFGSLEEAFDAHAQLLMNKRYAGARAAASPEAFADRLTGIYATDHSYGSKLRDVMHHDHLTQYDKLPIEVTVRLPNAPVGTSATVRAGAGKGPAVSHAFAH